MPVDPGVQVKITSSVCSSVAVASTIYRLIIRRRRLWFDDGWALFSMISLIVQVIAVFLDVPHPQPLSQKGKVTRYYLMAVTFYCVIWPARLSILFSMIRINPFPKRRRLLIAIAGLFIFVWIILTAQLFWVCEPNPRWKLQPSPQCPLNRQVAICQLVSDVVADAILLIAPLQLLAVIRDKWLRYRLIIIFSTCIVTTIVSLVHAVYILTESGTPSVVISALVEDSISLIVCNIPVVVAGVVHLGDVSIARREGRLPSFIKFATFRPATTTVVESHELSEDMSIAQFSSPRQARNSTEDIPIQKPRHSNESSVDAKQLRRLVDEP